MSSPIDELTAQLDGVRELFCARQLRELGRLKEAIDLYGRLVATSPNNTSHRIELALTLSDAGRHREAEREADEARHLSPDEGDPHYAIAYVAAAQGKWKIALPAARRAVELAPHDAFNQAMLGTACAALNRWSEADIATTAALAIDPQHTIAIAARAAFLRGTGRGDEAHALLRSKLDHDAENDIALCQLGWHALRSGQRRDAIGHFRAALQIDPQYQDARHGLAEAMRSRSWLYGSFFRLVAYLSDRQTVVMWALLLAFILGPRLIAQLSASNVLIQQAATTARFFVFVVCIFWLLMPALGVVLLYGDPDGQTTMTMEERRHARWQRAILLLTLLIVVLSPLLGRFLSLQGLIAGITVSLAVYHAFSAAGTIETRVTKINATVSIALVALPLVAVVLLPAIVLLRLPIELLVPTFQVLGSAWWIAACGLLIAWMSGDIGRWISAWFASRRQTD